MNAIPAAACCPSDSCTLSTTTLYDIIAQVATNIREVYYGSGDPNGVVVPDVPTLAAWYYNTDVPGEAWQWNVDAQIWQ